MTVAHWYPRGALQRPRPIRGGAGRGPTGGRAPARWVAAPRWGLVELVEAAARSGEPELASDALERLSETTRASGTDWALGVEARSRALLSDGDAAEPLYREAIERLARTRVRVELARAQLVYGEWLRRENRRLDAREHLRTAYEMFRHMGVEGFAERARRELLGYRRDRAQTPGGDARRPHTSGSADRAARAGGPLQSRDRRAAVHQPPYGAVPPAEGLRQARHHLAQPAQPRSRQPPQPGVADATSDQRLATRPMRVHAGRGTRAFQAAWEASRNAGQSAGWQQGWDLHSRSTSSSDT